MTGAGTEARRLAGSRPWGATGALILLLALAVGGSLDDRAQAHVEAAFDRALLTFALARALNGVISVVQGTEVAVEPAGVGVTFAPGEIVDPLNDLVERFSWVMLASTTSLGIQQLLLEMSSWGGTRAVAAAAALLAIFLLWRRSASGSARRWALRLAALAAFLRLAMPLVGVLNHGAYLLFMEDDYEAARRVVEETTARLAELGEEEAPPEPEGWLDRARGWLDEQASALDVRERLGRYEAQLSSASEHLLRLTAVFLAQTIALPLLFLWALARALGALGRRGQRPGQAG